MPFQPIQKREDLPEIGARREALNLDFKQTVEGAPVAELAKDVAAFANASGGTVLVGANEDASSGTLQGWVPMSKEKADAARASFDMAVRDWCSPAPVFSPEVIERESGQYVVAVNVWPYPLLPVSVRVKTDKALTGRAWDAWVVFVRVGTHNKPFTPEQAAMLMIPSVRHAVMMLDSIPDNKRTSVRVFLRDHQTDRQLRAHLALKCVDPLQNVAVFQGTSDPRPGDIAFQFVAAWPPVHIPLSDIDAVWSMQSGDWCLKVNGSIGTTTGDRAGEPFYIPSGAS